MDGYGFEMGWRGSNNVKNTGIERKIGKIFTKNGTLVKLTQREKDIISCLIMGMRTKRIALSLDIAPRTVDNNIGNIRGKLEVSSREEIIEIVRKSENRNFFLNTSRQFPSLKNGVVFLFFGKWHIIYFTQNLF